MDFLEIKPGFFALPKIFVFWLILCFAFPIGLSIFFDVPVHTTLFLIISTLTLEYFAVPVGVALGMPYFFVLAVMTSVALSVVFLMFEIFGFLGVKSKRVSDFLSMSKKKADTSRIIREYGVYGLIPGAILLGFYICPAAAFALGWEKNHSAIMILTGFVFTSIIMLLASIGVLSFF